MRKISEHKRSRMTGKGGGSTFLQLPHFVINSPQWAALEPKEVKMLIEIAAQYNGKNNGDLSYPRKRYKERGWSGNGLAGDALAGLQEKGWLLLTRQGGRNGCSLYAVTFFPVDASDKHPCAQEHKPSHHWKQAPVAGGGKKNEISSLKSRQHVALNQGAKLVSALI